MSTAAVCLLYPVEGGRFLAMSRPENPTMWTLPVALVWGEEHETAGLHRVMRHRLGVNLDDHQLTMLRSYQINGRWFSTYLATGGPLPELPGLPGHERRVRYLSERDLRNCAISTMSSYNFHVFEAYGRRLGT